MMTAPEGPDRDYVLGTHDEEIERLGLQHRLWRPRALDAWSRAGFAPGQTLIDVGCGPGWAALDLAELVGPKGRVHALDRSRRFLDALETECRRRKLDQLTTHEIDLDDDPLPVTSADGAWGRWIFAFVRHPRDLLARIGAALEPGGALVLHEYFDYRTWRTAPRCAAIEEFVDIVVDSWRAGGGEPDIALDIPRWLEELGFEVRELRPFIDVVSPSSPVWKWPESFIDVGLRRFVELGRLTEERADAMREAIAAASAEPHVRMITPAVLEIVATRR